ncbi:hypothetical protein GCM10012287_07630 [Streptomyces daqingensis]|uniref:Integral membrane protein n=1 Tax=Streptomyces daqingensis TaxID=1472640 RepID=A0ABQ2LV25_9ACTN|nr:hypothetical protein [Streptomyces daqingensis]GGO43745.1 hypothetical protein GCM10012287_07630 [Streptomyces daqingensis]
MSGRLHWRYAVLGAGFLALAAVRTAQGATVWGVVFLAAAAANAWLAVHEGRPRTEPAGPGGAAHQQSGVPRADSAQVERSLEGYRASRGQWKALAAGCLAVGAGLLLVEPPLAVFAGGAALFAVLRARRAGHAVATLRRARLVRE